MSFEPNHFRMIFTSSSDAAAFRQAVANKQIEHTKLSQGTMMQSITTPAELRREVEVESRLSRRFFREDLHSVAERLGIKKPHLFLTHEDFFGGPPVGV